MTVAFESYRSKRSQLTLSRQLARLGFAAAVGDYGWLRVPVFTDLLAVQGLQLETQKIERAFGCRTDPSTRAFLGACRMHARTQDDFLPSGRMHVGAVVIPAVAALDPVGDAGAALAAGFVVANVVSEAYAGSAQDSGLRPTGVFGPLAAAAAAAVAMGLDEESCASAISISATMSGGTTQPWLDGGLEWLTEVGVASRAGVEAALLAGAGMPTSELALEGDAGYSRALFHDVGAARLRDRIASWDGPAPIAVKKHPVSGIAQTPVTAAARAGPQTNRVVPDRIAVYMHPDELGYPGSPNLGPFRSRSDSLMSVARCASIGYLRGRISYELLSSPPQEDEAKVLARLEVVDDATVERGAARVSVIASSVETTVTATVGEVLYPVWDAVLADIGVWERAMEVPEGLAESVAELISGGFDGESLTAAVEGIM